jgi:hypothetical protein
MGNNKEATASPSFHRLCFGVSDLMDKSAQ